MGCTGTKTNNEKRTNKNSNSQNRKIIQNNNNKNTVSKINISEIERDINDNKSNSNMNNKDNNNKNNQNNISIDNQNNNSIDNQNNSNLNNKDNNTKYNENNEVNVNKEEEKNIEEDEEDNKKKELKDNENKVLNIKQKEDEDVNKNKNIIKEGEASPPPPNVSQEIKNDNEENSQNKENDINEKNVNSKMKILLINLEAKNANINDIKERLKILFQEIFEKFQNNQNFNEIKKEIIDRVFNTFDIYLKIPKDNHYDKTYLNNLIKYLYEKNDNINDFKNYLDAILENYIDFSKLGKNNENIIINYIIDFMKEHMENKKEKLMGNNENENDEEDNIYKKIKNKSIITYEEFIEIIMEDNKEKKFMENFATEYLLYKMKIDVKSNSMNAFDKKVFLDFYSHEKQEEQNKILITFK